MSISTQGLLPAPAQIGRIRLAVSSLSRSLAYYTTVLGLSVQTSSADLAVLTAQGSSDVLVELQELPGVTPVVGGSRYGLYHFAILLPSRSSLASFVEHLTKLGVTFGSADHGVSEALYLTDPDGLEIEVYADFPRENWRFVRGELELIADPLRLDALLAVPHSPWAGAPAGTVLGHIHFYVSDLKQARRFYVDALGFNVTHSTFPGALFVASGGYHHRVGLNTWARGATLNNSADARLLSWELLLDDDAEIADATKRLEQAGFTDLTDPWKNKLFLKKARQ